MITIDRIEGARAVLDVDGELVELPAAALPAGAREGDALSLSLMSADALRAEGEARLARLKAKSTLPDSIDL